MKKENTKKNILLLILFVLSLLLLLISRVLKFTVPVNNGRTSNNEYIELKNNENLKISIKSSLNDLSGMMVAVGDPDIPKECFFVSITDENNKEIYYNDLGKAQLFDNKYIEFNFDDIKESAGKKFSIDIVGSSNNLCRISLLKTSLDDENIKVIRNSEEVEDLNIVESGRAQTPLFKVFIAITLLIILFMFFRINFKDNNLKKRLLSKMRLFFLEFFLSFTLIVSSIWFIFFRTYYGVNKVLPLLLIALAGLVLLFVFSIFLGDKELKKEYLFLLLAIPIGLAYLLFIIPLHKPDEIFHYKSAYQLSELKESSREFKIPNISHERYYKQHFESINKSSYSNSITVKRGHYSFVLYMCSALGIFVFRMLAISPVLGHYFAALLNYLVFLIVGYYSIKKIPFGKMLLIIYMLNPMFLQQATSVSADALINIFSILFVAYILYLAYDKKSIQKKDFAVLAISYCIILVGKYAYFPIALLLLIIREPLAKFVKKNKKYSVSMLLGIMVVLFGWLFINKLLSVQTSLLTLGPQAYETKINYFIHNPLNYIGVLFNTLKSLLPYYIETLFGKRLGLLDIQINNTSYFVYIIILILSIFVDNSLEMKKKDRKVFLITFLIIFNIVLLGLYIGWGVINDAVIQGVQGRYFIPIAMLIPLVLINNKNKLLSKNVETILSLALCIAHVLVILDVVVFFR